MSQDDFAKLKNEIHMQIEKDGKIDENPASEEEEAASNAIPLSDDEEVVLTERDRKPSVDINFDEGFKQLESSQSHQSIHMERQFDEDSPR